MIIAADIDLYLTITHKIATAGSLIILSVELRELEG
jgi:hypothetical protein